MLLSLANVCISIIFDGFTFYFSLALVMINSLSYAASFNVGGQINHSKISPNFVRFGAFFELKPALFHLLCLSLVFIEIFAN